MIEFVRIGSVFFLLCIVEWGGVCVGLWGFELMVRNGEVGMGLCLC